MARIYQTGFEQNTTASDGLTASGSPTINSTTVNGGGSYSLEIKSLVSATGQNVSLATSFGSGNHRYTRFYLYIVTLPSAGNTIFSATNSTSAALLKLNGNGTIGLWDGSSIHKTDSSAVLGTGQWYCLELHTDITNAAGSRLIELRVNGIVSATTSTANISSSGCNFIMGGNLLSEAQTQGDWLFDDIAVNDGSGTAQNSWPGAGAIVHLLPNAAGDNNAWSIQTGGTAGAANNYTRVDEVTPNTTTDYNGSNTLGQLDDYACTSLPGGISLSSVTCVAVCSNFAGAGASSNASFVTRCKKASAGTLSEGATITPTSTTFVSNSVATRALAHVLYTDPDSAAWTTTTLNTMQIGMHLTATSTNATRVSTLWASVDYVPVVTTTLQAPANLTVQKTITTPNAVASVDLLKNILAPANATLLLPGIQRQAPAGVFLSQGLPTAIASVALDWQTARQATATVALDWQTTQQAPAGVTLDKTGTALAPANVTLDATPTRQAPASVTLSGNAPRIAPSNVTLHRASTSVAPANTALNKTATRAAPSFVALGNDKFTQAPANAALLKTGNQRQAAASVSLPLLTFTIYDRLYDGSGNPMAGYSVTLQPQYAPLLVNDSGGTLRHTSAPWPATTTDSNGSFLLVGPMTTQQYPQNTSWQIGPLPDGTTWHGLPMRGVFTIPQLMASGWQRT